MVSMSRKVKGMVYFVFGTLKSDASVIEFFRIEFHRIYRICRILDLFSVILKMKMTSILQNL